MRTYWRTVWPIPEKPRWVSPHHFPTLAQMEKAHICKALEKTKGRRDQAAHLLGILVRTLRIKLRRYMEEAKRREAEG